MARLIIPAAALLLWSAAGLGAAPLRLAVGNSPPSSASWTVGPLTEANLTAGAGSDVGSTSESPAAQVLLNLRASPIGSWKVSVRRADVSWNARLHLYVRRTGPGAGTGTVSGGLAYLEVTTTDILLFTGTLTVNSIPLQLRLDGISAVLGAGTLSTSVLYTATEP